MIAARCWRCKPQIIFSGLNETYFNPRNEDEKFIKHIGPQDSATMVRVEQMIAECQSGDTTCLDKLSR